jgi:hypothetical protein
VTDKNIIQKNLFSVLTVYFVLVFGSLPIILAVSPTAFSLMPVGGANVMRVLGIEQSEEGQTLSLDSLTSPANTAIDQIPTLAQIARLVIFLSASIIGTILIMLPIAWTYSVIKREIGFRKSFVRTLLALPICATTIVMLIQNNLALAFGLAAMVAAVRFRVALQEAIDGIFIFASICVGLAAGIGHLGVAAVMAVFFCFANAILWKLNFGRNPVDDARATKKLAELEGTKAPEYANRQAPIS